MITFTQLPVEPQELQFRASEWEKKWRREGVDLKPGTIFVKKKK